MQIPQYFLSRPNSKQVEPAPSTTPSPIATSSREASPRSRRPGKTFLKDVLPRFSISLEEDNSLTSSSPESHDSKTSHTSSKEGSSKEGLHAERQSRPVVKSASSTGLSLVIPPGNCLHSYSVIFACSLLLHYLYHLSDLHDRFL